MPRLAAVIAVAHAVLAAPGVTHASDETGEHRSAPAPEDVRRAWRTRLDGRHFGARIRIVMKQGGREEGTRVLQVWRDDRGEASERLLARFHEPFDLRGVGVLYLEQAGRANDYFLYQPSSGRVRRVPEDLAREDLYGLDLEFLGFDVAGDEPTAIESMEPVRLDDRNLLRLTERPESPAVRFDRRTVWLDPRTFIPMRSEYELHDATTIVASTLEVRDVQGVPTPVHTRFVRPAESYVVDLYIEEIDYEEPIQENFFSTFELTKRWYRAIK